MVLVITNYKDVKVDRNTPDILAEQAEILADNSDFKN